MTTTATITRICPEWCTLNVRHIEPEGEGGHSGPSWPEVPSMQGTWINGHYCGISVSTGSTKEDAMAVYLEAPGVEMTPEQAIEAGRYLIEAGQWALAHQVVKNFDPTSEIAWSDMSAEAQSAFVRGVYSTFDPSTIK